MNRKIIMSLGVVVFVAALSWGATGAFFSDSETSTGNTFTAGDIDLQIGNESYVTSTTTGALVASPSNSWAINNLTNQLFFSFDDVKPGDVGEDTIAVRVGSNDAWACMAADITATPENTLVDPETDAGDVGPALGDNGELQNFLNFTFWKDDGDNVYETGETQITQLTGQAGTIFNGSWLALADSANGPALVGDSTNYIGKAWCFGTLALAPVAQDGLGKTGSNGPLARGTGVTCDGSGNNNVAQTDGAVVDVSFQAVQSRNNGQFLCSSLPVFVGTSTTPVATTTTVVVTDETLATTSGQVIGDFSKWLFYNDVTDTVMTLNEFSGSGGVNEIVAGPDSVGAAQMTLHDALARYNIATYKYKDVKLADIGTLSYRIYDASASSETPYLHFNVDLLNNDTWQNRLVQVPTGVVANTWTTVDALAGMWYKSGGNWPVGVNTAVPFSGATPRTWADIVADYPNAETRSTDSFLGVRVGHPGPAGENSFVDWINFDGETTDFE